MIYSGRWSAIRRGRGDLPPIVEGLQFFGDLTSSRTSIVSGAVATLGDASGYNRDATQGAAGNRPTYNASDSRFGGRPSMTGDGIDDVLITAAPVDWTAGTDKMTALFVGVTEASVATGSRAWTTSAGQARYQSTTLYRSLFSNGGNTYKTATLSATVPSVLATTFDCTVPAASVPEVYLGGAATGLAYGSVAATVAGAAVSTLAILALAIGTAPCAASMTDLLIYAGNKSAGDVATISSWLAWRNGL